MTGCKCTPKIIEKPVYQKIIKYPKPERKPPRKLDENYGPFETDENARKLLYNIADDQTHIKDLLDVIEYYEKYTEKEIEDTDVELSDEDIVQ